MRGAPFGPQETPLTQLLYLLGSLSLYMAANFQVGPTENLLNRSALRRSRRRRRRLHTQVFDLGDAPVVGGHGGGKVCLEYLEFLEFLFFQKFKI